MLKCCRGALSFCFMYYVLCTKPGIDNQINNLKNFFAIIYTGSFYTMVSRLNSESLNK